MNDTTSSLRNDLHFIYGVNCYQFALGDYTPYVCAYCHKDGNLSLTYLSMLPGDPKAPEPSFEDPPTPSDLEAYKTALVKGCHDDGLIDIGTSFQQKEGHDTVALLFDATAPVFHFLKYSNGEWLSKFSMGNVTSYPSLEAALKSINAQTKHAYELRSYFQVPHGTVPLIVKGMETENVLARSSDGSLQPLKRFFLEKLSWEPSGHSIEINPSKKEARHLDNMKSIPFPAWPFYPGDTVKEAFKKHGSILDRFFNKKQDPKPIRLPALPRHRTDPDSPSR